MRRKIVVLASFLIAFNVSAQWVSLTSGTTVPLHSVYFINPGTGDYKGYVTGESGTVLKTTNYGDTWTPLSSGTSYTLRSVYFIPSLPSTGYAVGSCYIYKTTNSGVTWSPYNIGVYEGLLSISFPTLDTGYVAGMDGTIFKTTDSGSTWYALSSGTYESFSSICFTNSLTGHAVGSSGTVLKTTDGGVTWSAQFPVGPSYYFRSMFFYDANIGYAVGDDGIIIKTSNGGVSWDALYSDPTFDLLSVHFPTPDIGYAVGGVSTGVNGYSSRILKTTDGGASWTLQFQSPDGSYELFSVFFINENIGFATGMLGTILRTNNGGNVWIEDKNDKNENNINLAPNPNNGIFNLNTGSEIKEDFLLDITDITGKIVYSEHLKKTAGNDLNKFDFSTFPNGIYFMKITDGIKELNQKLIIEK